MKILLITLLLTLVLVGVSCGSNTSLPSNSEIVGSYMGRYGNGVETFDMNADGSFTQTFRIGTNVVYNSSGKWKIKGRSIDFSPFMSPDGMWSGNFDGKPDLAQVAPGSWERDPIRIEFTEWPYHVAKTKGEGATIEPYK